MAEVILPYTWPVVPKEEYIALLNLDNLKSGVWVVEVPDGFYTSADIFLKAIQDRMKTLDEETVTTTVATGATITSVPAQTDSNSALSSSTLEQVISLVMNLANTQENIMKSHRISPLK